MPAAQKTFSEAAPEDIVLRGIDFANGLVFPGEMLLGVPTCTLILVEGVDLTPQARLMGTPTITGTIVTVKLGTMLDGCVYQVLITVQTSAGQVLSCWTDQICAAP